MTSRSCKRSRPWQPVTSSWSQIWSPSESTRAVAIAVEAALSICAGAVVVCCVCNQRLHAELFVQPATSNSSQDAILIGIVHAVASAIVTRVCIITVTFIRCRRVVVASARVLAARHFILVADFSVILVRIYKAVDHRNRSRSPHTCQELVRRLLRLHQSCTLNCWCSPLLQTRRKCHLDRHRSRSCQHNRNPASA